MKASLYINIHTEMDNVVHFFICSDNEKANRKHVAMYTTEVSVTIAKSMKQQYEWLVDKGNNEHTCDFLGHIISFTGQATCTFLTFIECLS